jgi:hypothetical protein
LSEATLRGRAMLPPSWCHGMRHSLAPFSMAATISSVMRV